MDIGDIMRSLQSRVRQRSLPANQVNVLRGEEFDCAVRAFSRSAFDPESRLDVVFVDENGVGEGAVDEGGPTREFCRLLMGQLQQHHIFEGPSESRALALDSVGMFGLHTIILNVTIYVYFI